MSTNAKESSWLDCIDEELLRFLQATTKSLDSLRFAGRMDKLVERTSDLQLEMFIFTDKMAAQMKDQGLNPASENDYDKTFLLMKIAELQLKNEEELFDW